MTSNSGSKQVTFEFWSKERCDMPYSPPDNLLGLKCVKEKDHVGKHVFYVEWNIWT